MEDIRAALVAYTERGHPDALDDAVGGADRILGAPGFPDLPGPARAYALSLAATARTARARTRVARADDLDRAITQLRQAAELWPVDDVNLGRTLANLAAALCDRFDRDHDLTDLDQADAEFAAAVPELRAHGERVDVALHNQAECLRTRARFTVDPAPLLSRAVGLFEEALTAADADAESRAGHLNGLGLALRGLALTTGETAHLHRSEGAYRAALIAAAPDGEAVRAAAANLAIVLLDLADVDGDVNRVRQAVSLYRELLTAAGPSEQVQFTTNLAATLVDLYRFARDRHSLEEAVRSLRSAIEQTDGPGKAVGLATLGAAVHEMFEHTGDLALLDEAITLQRSLVDTGPPDPRRLLNLGISLLARFRRRRQSADLDSAADLFEQAANSAGRSIEHASARNSLANTLSLRFDVSQDPRDLDRCVAQREQAVAAVPAGSLDRAVFLGNLGVDLLKRHGLTGDRDDLERAVTDQRAAVAALPESATAQPRLLAALGDSLARRAVLTGAAADIDDTRTAYQAAVAAGRSSLPEQALGASLRWAAWEAARGCWAEAGDACTTALDALTEVVTRQRARADKESWLGDAQTLPALAGLSLARSGRRRAAVLAVERSRAVLLVEALGTRPE